MTAALYLLSLFLPESDSETICGDLVEENRGARWLWSQVVRSILHLSLARVRRLRARSLVSRSVLAVIAGYVTIAAAVILTSVVLSRLLTTPGLVWMLLDLATAFGFGVGGGYVTAWIAGRNGRQHALGLGCFCIVMGFVSMALNFGLEPLWYQIALIVIAPTSILIGGEWRAARSNKERG